MGILDRLRRKRPDPEDELLNIPLGSIVELRDPNTIENSADHDPVSYTVTERRSIVAADLRRLMYKLELGEETVFLAVDEDPDNSEVTVGRFVVDNEHETEEEPPESITLEFDGASEEFQLTFQTAVELAVRAENRETTYDAKIYDYESQEGVVLLIERCGSWATDFLGYAIDRTDAIVYPSDEDEGKYIEDLGA